ncbi:MAG: radical SAM protein [Candidatus Diapherotrites archaeon]|nr:radical SAM protein [Candidatus Diapherotrites archaeon]
MTYLGKVEIVLGFACNNNCLFCSVGNRNQNKSTEEIKKEIMLALGKDFAEEINFTGGEPTIRKDLCELIAFARKNGAKEVRITTNGLLLSNKAFLDQMIAAGLTGVILSIHGLNPETHDFLCNVKGAFEKAIKGLENASKANLTIDVNFVLNKINFNELPKLAEFLCNNYQIRAMCIIFPDIDGNLLNNKWLIPTFAQVSESVDSAASILKNHGITVWVMNMPPCSLKKNKDSATCGQLKTKMYWFDMKVDLETKIKSSCEKLKICKDCRFANNCPGISKKYVAFRGLELLGDDLKWSGH